MYQIQPYTYKQAKILGVEVKSSTRKNKKIDVYKNGTYICSIGFLGMKDFPTYLKEKGIELCEFDIILTTKQCSKPLIQLYNEVDEYDIKRILCDKN